MNDVEQVTDGLIRYRYPTPVAAPYRLAQISRSPAVRLSHAIGAIDQTVRFCCFVLLADYLTLPTADERIEERLKNLNDLGTSAAHELLIDLLSVFQAQESFVPELVEALSGDVMQRLSGLVEAAQNIRIERSALDIDSAVEHATRLVPELARALGDLSCLEKLFVVRPEVVDADERSHWYLVPWRGVQNCQPLVVESNESLEFGIGATILVRGDSDQALRLDPLMVAGGAGRLYMLLGALNSSRALYGHYASSYVGEWEIPLSAALTDREHRPGRITLGLDETSRDRVAQEIIGGVPELEGYQDVVATVIDDAGRHFRAVHTSSEALHSVVLVHDHLCRNGDYARRLLAFVESVTDVVNPYVDAPVLKLFDANTGQFAIGSTHARYGRLADRIPEGAKQPVVWSVKVADALLGALDALGESNIFLGSLPAWAISIHSDGTPRVVPALVPHDGRSEDSARLVAELLYRMLMGFYAEQRNPLQPSLVRKAVPESLDLVILRGLAGEYATVTAMRADLRMAQHDLEDEPQDAFATAAIQRTYSFLQKVMPGELTVMEQAAQQREESKDWEGLLDVLHGTIAALWDPDVRLSWVKRLVNVAQDHSESRERVFNVFQQILNVAEDHLPTLEFAAACFKDAIRGEDRARLYKRMLHASVDEDEVVRALSGLASLCEDRRDLDTAREHWERLTTIRAHHAEAWRGLCRIHRVVGEDLALAGALDRLLALIDEPDERLDLVRELAVLKAGPLNDTWGAVTLLREVVSHADVGVGAWEVLRDLARDLNDDSLLVEALAGLAEHPNIDTSEKYIVQLERAIALGVRGIEPLKAVSILDELLAERPGDRAVLSYRALIFERTARWLDATGALEEWASSEMDPWCLAQVLRRLASITADQLGDNERAKELFEGVLQTAPTDTRALNFLEGAYLEAEQWPELTGVLQTLLDTSITRDRRASVQLLLARTLDEKLNDHQGAFHAYSDVLRTDPSHIEYLERYSELADTVDGWDEARSIVEKSVPHLDGSEAQEWKRRLGQMRLEQDEDLSAVVTYFRDAVAESPNDIPALSGLLGALERVGAWEEHAETLRRLVELETDSERIIERLHALASTLRNRVLAPKLAAETYEEILHKDSENVEAMRGLCAVGESAGRSAGARVRALKRWIPHCHDPLERLECFEAVIALAENADMGASELVEIFEQTLELDPANQDALQGLEVHYAKREDWNKVATTLERHIKATAVSDTPQLSLRLASVQIEHLADFYGAERTLDNVLEQHPGYDEAFELLCELLERTDQYERLVDLLGAHADQTVSETKRAELLYRIGRITAEQLGSVERAVGFMERALAQDQRHLRSLEFLTQVYVAGEQWDDAGPVAEALVAYLDEGESADQTQIVAALLLLGDTRLNLNEPERAKVVFERALDLDPASIGANVGLAAVAATSKEYTQAEVHYKDLLAEYGDDLDVTVRAEIEASLAEIASVRGDDEASRRLLEGALSASPKNADSLRELIDVCSRQSDWDAVAQYLEELQSLLQEPLDRFACLMELAELYQVKLAQHDDARRILEEARVLKPDSTAVPVKLLDVYLETQRYKEAVDTLLGLIERESSDDAKARFTYALAILYRDQIGDAGNAVELFNKTLDLLPSKLEAFEALDQILVNRKDWSGQAESYLAMLDRISADENVALEFSLRKNLAQIYRTVLPDPAAALTQLVQAVKLKPDDIEIHAHYARALEEVDPDSELALNEHRKLLRVDPSQLESWKALGRIFAKRRNRDAAWCVCGVLTLLEIAEDKEQQFYTKHQKPALALRKGLNGDDHWQKHLFSDEQDVLLGQIFSMVARALGGHLAVTTLTELGLTAKDRVNLRVKSRFSGFLATVAKILQVPTPSVYRNADQRGITKEALFPPIMVVGPDVLTGRKGKELRFLLGKAMAYFWGPHQLAGMYPVGHLRTLLLATMQAVMPDLQAGNEPGVKGFVTRLEDTLTKQQRVELQALCEKLASSGTPPNLKRWLRDVEKTANHAAHLLCNDLDVSVRMIREQRDHNRRWSDLSVKDAISDLATYTVSDRFLTLRRDVGAAIEE